MTDRITRTSDATMAVYLDLENIALGARDAKYPSFDIEKVLERLLLKGHIVVKKAYCDFDRYKDFKRGLHEAAFELIEIPHVRQSGKNSADIRMVVDALDLCYTKGHVDTFVIISGDSKVRRRNSAAATRPSTATTENPAAENKGPDVMDAFHLVVETLEAVIEERGENEPIWGSMIKQAIKRRHPGFNERAYGFRSFNDLLADAQKRGLLTLRADEKSGGYTVRVEEKAPTR
jgi:hypothetical protein